VRYGQGLALAFEFVGTIAAGVVAGWMADKYLGTEPLWLIVGAVFASIAAFVRLVRTVRRLERSGEPAVAGVEALEPTRRTSDQTGRRPLGRAPESDRDRR
jgi:F0F1-type ATP synthase assembly protein I